MEMIFCCGVSGRKKNLGKQYTGHGLADWMKQGKEKKRHIPEFDVAHILVQHCSCTGQTHLFSYLNSSQCSPGTVPELGSQVIQIICILSLLSSTPLHIHLPFFSPSLFPTLPNHSLTHRKTNSPSPSHTHPTTSQRCPSTRSPPPARASSAVSA